MICVIRVNASFIYDSHSGIPSAFRGIVQKRVGKNPKSLPYEVVSQPSPPPTF